FLVYPKTNTAREGSARCGATCWSRAPRVPPLNLLPAGCSRGRAGLKVTKQRPGSNAILNELGGGFDDAFHSASGGGPAVGVRGAFGRPVAGRVPGKIHGPCDGSDHPQST